MKKKTKVKTQLEIRIDKRVSLFCKKYNLNVNLKTINKYASIKMNNDESISWESHIVKNPYILMNLDGVGFIRADGIAMKLNFPFDHEYRILAYVGNAVENLSKGSTIIKVGDVFTEMSNKLNISNFSRIVDVVLNKADNTYKLLDEKCKITLDQLEVRFITKTNWYESEKLFYTMCMKASKRDELIIDQEIINKVINDLPYKLNDGQLLALNSFYKFGVNILTGVSGGGKTTVTKAILDVLSLSKQSFTCLTPTGISSKVFTEFTGILSSTIHSFYYSRNPIETDWLILDECSMHSVEHINMICKRIDIKNPPRLLFIGDVNQLTPISVGDPFYSLIKLKEKIKMNIIKLTEIMRASDELYIPHLCNQFIGATKYDYKNEEKKHAGVNFHELEKDVPKQILNILSKNNFSFDNTYIICPQNIGEYGNEVINNYLDPILSDGEILYKDKFKTFRKGSILMHIKNNSNLDIYNGERIKLIEKIDEKTLICKKIDDGTEIEYDIDILKEQTMLAYSISCHKCQGLTTDNVIFIASNKFYHMNSRNLVYTALSRASKNLVVLYDKNSLFTASKKEIIDDRITFLGLLSKM